jgi:hypothetical protein
MAGEQGAEAAQETDIREELAEQRNTIRHAAQKGMSLKAAYITLNGKCQRFGTCKTLL